MPRTIFVDSDVIISSLLSSTGAAHLLLNTQEDLKLFISNVSFQESEAVTVRLDLNPSHLRELVNHRFATTQLLSPLAEIQKDYGVYVTDIHDAHIVAGAHKAGVEFLITYNTKHFKIDKIKNDFNILIKTPAQLLQYVRSL